MEEVRRGARRKEAVVGTDSAKTRGPSRGANAHTPVDRKTEKTAASKKKAKSSKEGLEKNK